MSHAIQSSFAEALTDRSLTVPQGLTSWTGPRPERRFAVYRNNVSWGLTESLRARFPVTDKIVGDSFFNALAQAFVAAHPPLSPLLLNYGDDLAAFVEAFEPAASLPYLADVIRLEAARSKAYHAEDMRALDPACLSTIAPEALSELVFDVHPSVSVVRSVYPIVTIWAMNSGDIALAPIDPWLGEDVLVVRPEMIVNVHKLPMGGADFIAALIRGSMLGEAIEIALHDSPDFDLTANLTGILQTGCFAAIHQNCNDNAGREP